MIGNYLVMGTLELPSFGATELLEMKIDQSHYLTLWPFSESMIIRLRYITYVTTFVAAGSMKIIGVGAFVSTLAAVSAFQLTLDPDDKVKVSFESTGSGPSDEITFTVSNTSHTSHQPQQVSTVPPCAC